MQGASAGPAGAGERVADGEVQEVHKITDEDTALAEEADEAFQMHGADAAKEKAEAAARRAQLSIEDLTDADLDDEAAALERERAREAGIVAGARAFDAQHGIQRVENTFTCTASRLAKGTLPFLISQDNVVTRVRDETSLINIGDNILAVNGTEVTPGQHAHALLAKLPLDVQLQLVVLRDTDEVLAVRQQRIDAERTTRRRGSTGSTATPEFSPRSAAIGGVTSTPQLFMSEVLYPAAVRLMSDANEDEEEWCAASYEPIIGEGRGAEDIAVLAFAKAACDHLHTAHAGGHAYGTSQPIEAAATFTALAGGPWALDKMREEMYVPLFNDHPTPQDLPLAWVRLWRACVCAYVEANAPAVPIITPPPPAMASPHDERRVSAYVAGWGLKKVLAHAVARKLPELQAMLLFLKATELPPEDPATPYMMARQQFDGLMLPVPLLITAYELARHVLTDHLEREVFRHPPQLSRAYERAVKLLLKDASVDAAFEAACGGGPAHSPQPMHTASPPPPTVPTLPVRAPPSLDAAGSRAALVQQVKQLLLERLTNCIGGEYRRMIISMTGAARDENSIGIRARLKVEQVKTASKDIKETSPTWALNAKTHLNQPSAVVHQLLMIIAAERRGELSTGSGMTVAVMQAVLRACVAADSELDASLLKPRARKGVLEAAIVSRLEACPDGFVRFELVSAALKSKK